MNRSDNGKPGRRVSTRRRSWLWVIAAVAAGAGVTMYVYQKSLEDDLEAMLRAALQQFHAEAADAGADSGQPDPDAASDPR